MSEEKIQLWNERAQLGKTSGSDDYMLKDLEQQTFGERIEPNSKVLDIGCGDGKTLINLAKLNNCTGTGIDFAADMIALSQKNSEEAKTDDKINFEVKDLRNIEELGGSYDYVISERSLINLDNTEEQHKVLQKAMSLLKPGGAFLMIECSEQGLKKVNKLRAKIGLNIIPNRWHNIFVDEEEVKSWQTEEITLEELYPFSGTYYFLSRIVYAKLNQGQDLKYDSEINKLSCELPMGLTDVCSTKLWVWRKTR
jgi:ubiquinone/menaquinone biosynthesis C-methylase UbiE